MASSRERMKSRWFHLPNNNNTSSALGFIISTPQSVTVHLGRPLRRCNWQNGAANSAPGFAVPSVPNSSISSSTQISFVGGKAMVKGRELKLLGKGAIKGERERESGIMAWNL